MVALGNVLVHQASLQVASRSSWITTSDLPTQERHLIDKVVRHPDDHVKVLLHYCANNSCQTQQTGSSVSEHVPCLAWEYWTLGLSCPGNTSVINATHQPLLRQCHGCERMAQAVRRSPSSTIGSWFFSLPTLFFAWFMHPAARAKLQPCSSVAGLGPSLLFTPDSQKATLSC